jgi:hypothetical protein
MMLVRELLGCVKETFERRKFLVLSPNGVDGQHRPRGYQVDELDAARKLLDQGADDEADAAAVRDVAPHAWSATPTS